MVPGDNLEARSFHRSIGYVDQDVITMGRALDGGRYGIAACQNRA